MEQEVLPDDAKTVLKETFKVLKADVAVEVFTKEGVNDTYNNATVKLLETLASLNDKIKPLFYKLDDEQAKKREVFRSPTVLIAPDKYGLRFTGAPLGEEGRSLIFSLIMASTDSMLLSPDSLKRLLSLKDKRTIQVYVSPT